jgi:membrane glycosyltransferase
MSLLALPKLFSLVLQLRERNCAAQFGGRGKLGLGVLLEIVFSTLLAPVMAQLQTRFVAPILMGRPVG